MTCSPAGSSGHQWYPKPAWLVIVLGSLPGARNSRSGRLLAWTQEQLTTWRFRHLPSICRVPIRAQSRAVAASEPPAIATPPCPAGPSSPTTAGRSASSADHRRASAAGKASPVARSRAQSRARESGVQYAYLLPGGSPAGISSRDSRSPPAPSRHRRSSREAGLSGSW